MVAVYLHFQAPPWFQLFAFAYGLYFIHHLATRILYKQRIHQIGSEVAIMAVAKRMGLWDEVITDQVNEYLDHRSFDLDTQKVWGVIRGRDW